MGVVEKDGYTFTRVWNVNGRLVVADTINEAVSLFKMYAESDTEPDSVERVFGDIRGISSDALIKEG